MDSSSDDNRHIHISTPHIIKNSFSSINSDKNNSQADLNISNHETTSIKVFFKDEASENSENNFNANSKREEQQEKTMSSAGETLKAKLKANISQLIADKRHQSKSTTKQADANLNENTDGFVTQLNVDYILKSMSSARVNMKVLDSEKMIPTSAAQEKRANKIHSSHESRRLLSSYPIFNGGSFNDLNDDTSTNLMATDSNKNNTIYSSFDNLATDRQTANNFLPSIESDRNRFPYRNNFTNKRLYIGYMANKQEKVNEELNQIRKKIQKNRINIKQSSKYVAVSKNNNKSLNVSNESLISKQPEEKKTFQKELTNLSNKSYYVKIDENEVMDDSTAQFQEEKQVFFDFRKASTPPSSQMEDRKYNNVLFNRSNESNQIESSNHPDQQPTTVNFSRFANRLLKNQRYLKAARSKTDSELNETKNDYVNFSKKKEINLNPKQSSTEAKKLSTKILNKQKTSMSNQSYQKLSNQSKQKSVVDLNALTNKAVVSSHYLCNTKRYLSEMNLYDVWPKSKMYKVSIKANPWVSSFKAKLFANEINSTYFKESANQNTPITNNLISLVPQSMNNSPTSSTDSSNENKNKHQINENNKNRLDNINHHHLSHLPNLPFKHSNINRIKLLPNIKNY